MGFWIRPVWGCLQAAGKPWERVEAPAAQHAAEPRGCPSTWVCVQNGKSAVCQWSRWTRLCTCKACWRVHAMQKDFSVLSQHFKLLFLGHQARVMCSLREEDQVWQGFIEVPRLQGGLTPRVPRQMPPAVHPKPGWDTSKNRRGACEKVSSGWMEAWGGRTQSKRSETCWNNWHHFTRHWTLSLFWSISRVCLLTMYQTLRLWFLLWWSTVWTRSNRGAWMRWVPFLLVRKWKWTWDCV